jgi:DNA polymerase-3 subunit alpha
MTDSFVHLHNHTEFSMLDGHSKHKELAEEVARLGQPAASMTDHGNMLGAHQFYEETTKAGVKPVLGVEAYVAPASRFDKKAIFWGPGGKRAERDADGESGDVSGSGAYTHLTLLARNATGVRQLFELTTRASFDGQYPKKKGRMDRDLITEVVQRDGQNIIASTGCPGGEVQTRLRLGQYDEAVKAAGYYRDLFGPENYFLEIMDHGIAVERRTREDLLRIGKELGIKPLATNDAHYVREGHAGAHDALLCVGVGKTIDAPKRFRFDGNGYYIKSAEQMRALFDDQVPGACDNTLLVASMVESYAEVFNYVNRMPVFPVPDGHDEESYLRWLVDKGIRERYGDNPTREVLDRRDYELSLVIPLGFAGYFLCVWDVCQFMHRVGIRFGPRGSAAGSLIIYALSIAALDPLKYGLIFERFINPERVSPPDVDLDIDERRRDEVVEYVERTYGSDYVSQIITLGMEGAKAAAKDAARILDLPVSVGERISKAMPGDVFGRAMSLAGCFNPDDKRYNEAQAVRDLKRDDPEVAKTIDVALGIEGRVRQTGVHACGVVLSKDPLMGLIPMQKNLPAKDGVGREVIVAGFEYPRLEAMGLQKMDFLGLRNWTVVDDCVKSVERRTSEKVDLAALDFDDQAVYDLLSRGETLGIFQLEGGGMQQLLRLMQPTEFEDIMAVGALYRPGPMGVNAHTAYALRKNGREPITPIHPELEETLRDILAPTQGVICFQEQVIAIAMKVAGYSVGRADLLRKAMGKKKPEVLAKEFEPFRKGMLDKGFTDAGINALWETLVPFADYAFGRAHTACYGQLAYYTAWLKAHHPVDYMAALLGSVGDDKDKLGVYLAECRRMQIKVLVPDVNVSEYEFTPVGDEIRFGLGAIRDVGTNVVAAVIRGRSDGPYASFLDFMNRVPIEACTGKAVRALIEAGAFDSLHDNRRALHLIYEQAVEVARSTKKAESQGAFDLFGSLGSELGNALQVAGIQVEDTTQPWSSRDQLAFERARLGLYVSGHPIEGAEQVLAGFRSMTIADLIESAEPGMMVQLAGLLTNVARKITKKGDPMAVATIEDLHNSYSLVIFPRTYQEVSTLLVTDSIVSVKGRINDRDGDPNLIVDKIRTLDLQDGQIPFVLRMHSALTTEPVVNGLRSILEQHRGDRPVRIVMDAGQPNGATYALPNYSVNVTTALIGEVKGLLGPSCVV